MEAARPPASSIGQRDTGLGLQVLRGGAVERARPYTRRTGACPGQGWRGEPLASSWAR